MAEPLGMEDPLPLVPDAWRRLKSSGFFVVDFEAQVATPSRFMASLGHKGDAFVHGQFQKLIHPGDLAAYQNLWNRVLDGQEDEFFVEYRVRASKGTFRWVQTLALVLERNAAGKVVKLFGLDRDIGLRKQSESLLHNRFLDLERRFLMSETLRIAGSMVTASLDLDSTIPVILEQAATLFAFHGARVWAYKNDSLELLGHEEDHGALDKVSPETGSLVLLVARDKAPKIIDNLTDLSWLGIPLLFQGECRGVMEFWHQESGFFRGEHVWPAMAFADNVAVGLFNARQYRATQEASETDPLTGLSTRRRLERMGPKIVEQALANHEELCAFMIDLDSFKQINDRHGHAQGDQVLKCFAQVALTVVRKGDVLCRYGGDEFIVLLPQTGPDQGVRVAERLRDLFLGLDWPFPDQPVTLSLGLACLVPGQHRDLDDLLAAADAALYRVKGRGRDGIEAAIPPP